MTKSRGGERGQSAPQMVRLGLRAPAGLSQISVPVGALNVLARNTSKTQRAWAELLRMSRDLPKQMHRTGLSNFWSGQAAPLLPWPLPHRA